MTPHEIRLRMTTRELIRPLAPVFTMCAVFTAIVLILPHSRWLAWVFGGMALLTLIVASGVAIFHKCEGGQW